VGPDDDRVAAPAAAAAGRALTRSNDGIEVRLLWDPADDRVIVAVQDLRTDDAFALTLGPDEPPLEAFHHPYAYAALRGIESRRLTAAAA
jgi:hypothetical protein